jgi:hypothetical protein
MEWDTETICSLEFGVCSWQRGLYFRTLYPLSHLATDTSMILGLPAPLHPLLAAAQPQYLASQHCLRQIRATTNRDETTTKRTLARGTSTSGSPVPSNPRRNSISSTPGCLPYHTPTKTVGYQNPTCRSPSPIDMLRALCPPPSAWRKAIASLHFAKSLRILQSPPLIKFPYPTLYCFSHFPIPNFRGNVQDVTHSSWFPTTRRAKNGASNHDGSH